MEGALKLDLPFSGYTEGSSCETKVQPVVLVWVLYNWSKIVRECHEPWSCFVGFTHQQLIDVSSPILISAFLPQYENRYSRPVCLSVGLYVCLYVHMDVPRWQMALYLMVSGRQRPLDALVCITAWSRLERVFVAAIIFQILHHFWNMNFKISLKYSLERILTTQLIRSKRHQRNVRKRLRKMHRLFSWLDYWGSTPQEQPGQCIF